MSRSADTQLKRVERDAVLACLAMAVVALVGAGGGPALAVLAGGLLIGASWLTIGAGVNAFVERAAGRAGDGDPAPSAPETPLDEPPPSAGPSPIGRPSLRWTVVTVGLRYALLALLAYVMIARLRLHPVGLLAGASSVVAAAAFEAFRLLKVES